MTRGQAKLNREVKQIWSVINKMERELNLLDEGIKKLEKKVQKEYNRPWWRFW